MDADVTRGERGGPRPGAHRAGAALPDRRAPPSPPTIVGRPAHRPGELEDLVGAPTSLITPGPCARAVEDRQRQRSACRCPPASLSASCSPARPSCCAWATRWCCATCRRPRWPRRPASTRVPRCARRSAPAGRRGASGPAALRSGEGAAVVVAPADARAPPGGARPPVARHGASPTRRVRSRGWGGGQALHVISVGGHRHVIRGRSRPSPRRRRRRVPPGPQPDHD